MRKLDFEFPSPIVTNNEITQLENFLELKFPASYRLFLLQCNGGGVAESNSCFKFQKDGELVEMLMNAFYSILGDREEIYDLKREYLTMEGRIPDDTIAVGADAFGNNILLGIKGVNAGKIFFGDHEDEGFDEPDDFYHNVYFVADSLEEFLDRLGPR